MASHNAVYPFRDIPVVSMATRALFGVFGLTSLMRAVIMGETLLFLETFELEATLEAVDKYKANCIPVSPSFIVALVKSDLTNYHLSSLRILICGETTSTGAMKICRQLGSVGGLRLSALLEAKIVDHLTGETLSPGQRGELWLRGPTVMKGYVGDEKATAEALDSNGWLKTGDLCYFDFDGFLFILDRLKEMIKCNGYQVGPYKRIHRVAFIDFILKSVTGKILRRELVNYTLFDTATDL
ncbi:hypothetical protein Dsin_031467 [Dipteronia sinensis]|uniref:AMP-dependent synthetase/ligase domain-containing protein n=1 Tax=Dipteronia sinensis TaxID=43782 RepID=A0AAD9ZLF4_9ROSI|nr:hypothetical protein Dsin_031467 [Dipteronia sinensis]